MLLLASSIAYEKQVELDIDLVTDVVMGELSNIYLEIGNLESGCKRSLESDLTLPRTSNQLPASFHLYDYMLEYFWDSPNDVIHRREWWTLTLIYHATSSSSFNFWKWKLRTATLNRHFAGICFLL